MGKTATKKTRLTGMTDRSTWGTDLQSELPIEADSEKRIRKMLSNAPAVKLKSGNAKSGDALWELIVERKGEPYVAAMYSLEHRGGRTFLNVQGNPTILACGENDIPILIINYPWKAANAITSTFQFCNRFLFILLELIPSAFPFEWTGEDRKRFERGDINIKQLQYAWYSADLGVDRELVLNFIRRVYTGDDDQFGIVRPLAEILGIKMEKWKGTTNTTLSVYHRNTRFQSLTLYKKDEHDDSNDDTHERLSSVIRFDCTFYYAFLAANKINTVKELEQKFIECCEDGGYDIGFYRWLNDKMGERYRLGYLAKITPAIYLRMLKKCEKVTSKPDQAIAKWWMNFGEYSTNIDLALKTELPEGHITEYVRNFQQATGIDITIPRHYLIRMLWYRMTGKMTIEEVEDYVKSAKLRVNNLVAFDKLLERDVEDQKVVIKHLRGENVVKFRRMNPRRISYHKMWILRQLQETAS